VQSPTRPERETKQAFWLAVNNQNPQGDKGKTPTFNPPPYRANLGPKKHFNLMHNQLQNSLEATNRFPTVDDQT
jgi:hypothetical protein